jgi:hypothetical protein
MPPLEVVDLFVEIGRELVINSQLRPLACLPGTFVSGEGLEQVGVAGDITQKRRS